MTHLLQSKLLHRRTCKTGSMTHFFILGIFLLTKRLQRRVFRFPRFQDEEEQVASKAEEEKRAAEEERRAAQLGSEEIGAAGGGG